MGDQNLKADDVENLVFQGDAGARQPIGWQSKFISGVALV